MSQKTDFNDKRADSHSCSICWFFDPSQGNLGECLKKSKLYDETFEGEGLKNCLVTDTIHMRRSEKGGSLLI